VSIGPDALYRYVELFLDEVESRGREPDAAECEELAELLVRLSQGNLRCEDVMQRLEKLLAMDLGTQGKQVVPARSGNDVTTIREFRALLQIVRQRT
jgi:argininosuccinate lyase